VQGEATAKAGRVSSIEEARELAREMSAAEPAPPARKGGFTKVPDRFIDHFMRLMKPSEAYLFLAVLRATRFDLGRFIRFRAGQLCRAAGISRRSFPVALARLSEAAMLQTELEGKTWKIQVRPEEDWDLSSFKNRKRENSLDR
jgi:hypothetical protein